MISHCLSDMGSSASTQMCSKLPSGRTSSYQAEMVNSRGMNIGIEKMHIGRQPILDRKKNLFAFELFFRSEADGISMDKMSSDDSIATAAVIGVAFNELGVDGPCNGF